MCMAPEQCDSCFDDIAKKVDQMVNVAKNSIVKMNYEHQVALEDRAIKNKEFHETEATLNKATRDSLVSTVQWFLGVVLILLVVSWGITGYTWIEVMGKADKDETVRRTEFELIIQQGDEFNRNVFEKKENIIQDTTTYIANKNLVFRNGLRSSENYKEAYRKQVEENNRN